MVIARQTCRRSRSISFCAEVTSSRPRGIQELLGDWEGTLSVDLKLNGSFGKNLEEKLGRDPKGDDCDKKTNSDEAEVFES